MNYELAAMALDGLVGFPLTIRVVGDTVEINGPANGFKELARLCLLLGASEGTAAGEAFELRAPLHLTAASAAIRLQRD